MAKFEIYVVVKTHYMRELSRKKMDTSVTFGISPPWRLCLSFFLLKQFE